MAATSPMEIALEEAREAAARGEVPVGAVIVHEGRILARNGNRNRELADPMAHAEALVIRGLSVGVPIARVFRLESLTGLLVGLVLAGLSLPAVWLVLGSAELAVTVALALLAACAVATVVAMSLPWLVARMGRDPAFGSGPLATVVQDLLSLVIYFAVAAVVIG